MNLTKILSEDIRVDKLSLKRKTSKIEELKNKGVDDDAKDIEAEIRSAHSILKIDAILRLKFSEAPDIGIILQNEVQIGIEVKRIRPKDEDAIDEDAIDEGRLSRSFTMYGKPRRNPWHWSVRDAILDKASKKYDLENIFLFILSDSAFQIESFEIEMGIIEASESLGNGLPFVGIFYQTVWQPPAFVIINLASLDSGLLESVRGSDQFKIKSLCNSQIV